LLDKLLILKDKNFIKVVTGVRRSEKSTLLIQFQELLKEKNSTVSIISINMELPEFRFLAEKKLERNLRLAQLQESVTNYVFIDEGQNLPEFEKLLEELYVTGSNAYLLSSELATILTGRAYKINVLPFSLLFRQICSSSSQSRTSEGFYFTELWSISQ